VKTPKVDSETDARIRAEVSELAGRFKTRKELSRETAALLFFRYGVYPSIQLVHDYTRLGSLTDIRKDLDEFWRDIRSKARISIEGADLPEDLLSQTGEVLRSLWSLALAKANESLDQLRAEAQKQVTDAQDQARQTQERLAEAQAMAKRAEEQQRTSDAAREEAERQLAITTTEKTQALEQVEAALDQARREAEARRQAEAQFSADLDAQRRARDLSEERLAGEVRFAKLQIDEARELSRVWKERATALEADRTLMETQLRRQISGQAEELGALRLEVGELRGRSVTLTEERDRLAARVDELMARFERRSVQRNDRLREQIREGLRGQLLSKPSAFELTELLEVELLFVEAADSDAPDLLYLGRAGPDGPTPITPTFSSLDELEAFCAAHLDRYEEIEVAALPERWFWDKS
jgi:hypothetical protein